MPYTFDRCTLILDNLDENETKVYLWCGSKEPYALKPHKELKRYLKNYEEEIMEGYGHGDFLMKHSNECCEKIVSTLGLER